jgi:hypothetical protein
MRLFRIAATIALIAYAILVCAQESETQWDFPDFSATQAFQTGRYEIPMKVYRYGSNVRAEMNSTMASLYITPSLKVYNMSIYPDGKRGCVVATEQQLMMTPSPLELLFGSKVKRTPEDSEVVEGHACKVEKVVVTRSDGTTIESKVWEAQDLKGVPVKIISQHPGGATFTAIYRDIVLGTPEKVLVSPPDKCTPYEQMWQVAEQHVYH